MITRGEYSNKKDTFGVMLNHTDEFIEIQLYNAGQLHSAFLYKNLKEYAYKSKEARELYNLVRKALNIPNKRNTTAIPFIRGISMVSEKVTKTETIKIEKFENKIVGLQYSSATARISLELYSETGELPKIDYVELTVQNDSFDLASDSLDAIKVRTVAEIAMEKDDVTWLNNKKYYIINDEKQAEQLFSYFENYNGVIAYDTETTGLKINCFGKIGSKYRKSLEEYNSKVEDIDKIRADELVGIIFCIEKDVSYYFPCKNRKFKNLYNNIDDEITRRTATNIYARYTVGDLRDETNDMANYIRKTAMNDWTPDIILMERVRNILQTRSLVAHNGTFEYKVGLLYDIDTNIKDDTMIMHQLMYKFRTTTSNRGEPSNLKYLSRVELGIDQWELGDFFPNISKNDDGLVRHKGNKKNTRGKNNLKIDFSYMDYDGTRIYAPADGDCTFQLFLKYKKDLVTNNKELEYLYGVEVIVSCAIGYMEFYGLRIDEKKITSTRDVTLAQRACVTSELRQLINYTTAEELEKYNELKSMLEKVDSLKDEEYIQFTGELAKKMGELEEIIENDKEHLLNLSAPGQVGNLFFNILKIESPDGTLSVKKSSIETILRMRNDDGSIKYPMVHKYSQYKNLDTLITKFFDNLPYFMYPGGFVFPGYGQISTATGRMNSSKPNAQQFPKSVTKIVIPREDFVMTDADYSQIEYRVMVAMSKEKKLLELFSDPDSDFHTLMASRMYGIDYASVTPKMRGEAKGFNFGIPYGMGFKSLAIRLYGQSTPKAVEEAKLKYDLYFKDQPKVKKFFEDVKEMAAVNRYTKTLWYRRRDYSFTDKDGKESKKLRAQALRQAGNAVIQGTAADIFKISVARNFMYIRQNKLFGDFLIVNMVHDEQLMEINYKKLNVQRVLRDIGENMQFKLEDFPPLYIGAGVGRTWNDAKGKISEIHPNLLAELSREADKMPLRATEELDSEQVYNYFSDRVYKFRFNMVKDYVENPVNFNKLLHPAIGNLINLQFSTMSEGEAKKLGMSDGEFLRGNLKSFIEKYNINSSVDRFKFGDFIKEDEDDIEYEDGDGEDSEGFGEEYEEQSFRILDTQDDIHGISIQDVIAEFGYTLSTKNRICGIDTRNKSQSRIEDIVNYLAQFLCEEDEENSVEIVFLTTGNVLNRTGIYVKNVSLEGLDKVMRGKK